MPKRKREISHNGHTADRDEQTTMDIQLMPAP